MMENQRKAAAAVVEKPDMDKDGETTSDAKDDMGVTRDHGEFSITDSTARYSSISEISG